MPDLHAVISTHTPRHLRAVLAGVAAQSRRPDRVAVSCDVDDPAIEEIAREAAATLRLDLTLVARPHQGQSRSAQVRNNGVRALGSPANRDTLLIFLDGDCCPAPGCFAAHEALSRHGDLILGFRHDLSAEQTEVFDFGALERGREPVVLTEAQRSALIERDRRYRRAAFLRRFGLTKPHKPKLLSANFAVSAEIYARINGFDEEYLGYGGEDDDLGRRVYAAGGRPVIGIKDAIVYHLWHPTRAATRWEDSPGIARFKQATPVRAAFGLDRPYAQLTPVVRRFGTASLGRETEPAPATTFTEASP